MPALIAVRRRWRLLVAVVLAVVLAAIGMHAWRPRSQSMPATHAGTVAPDILRSARVVETAHYRITSTATPAQTARVAEAVEALHRAWDAVFAGTVFRAPTAQLQLVLYRDRDQFKAHNRSRPWAEAYYEAPYCHAYYAEDEANPVHWMVHEATHQLGREVARFPRQPWIDEGMASYFAASRFVDGALQPGRIDPHAYPIWWLPRLAPGGDRAADLRDGRFIGLRALLTGTGPDLDRAFNLYYVEWWGLTHFLLHGDDGRHAAAYRRLAARGGTLADFERLVGPVEAIEPRWYAYLQARANEVAAMQEAETSNVSIE